MRLDKRGFIGLQNSRNRMSIQAVEKAEMQLRLRQ